MLNSIKAARSCAFGWLVGALALAAMALPGRVRATLVAGTIHRDKLAEYTALLKEALARVAALPRRCCSWSGRCVAWA